MRAFDWPTRSYMRVGARSWIICDNPRECDQWRVARLTSRLATWGKGKDPQPAKHAKARPHWYRTGTRNAVIGGMAAVALTFAGITARALMADQHGRPAVAAPSHTPSPARTEVVKVVRVKIPDGDSVDVPVGGSEAETRKAITRVVQKTLDAKRKGKGSKKSPKPSPSAKESPKDPEPDKGKNKPEAGKEPGENEGLQEPAPNNIMQVSEVLDTVLPKPAADPEAHTQFLAAPPPELRMFSMQLAAMGDVSEETAVQQDDTTAMAARVAIDGADDPITVAAAVTEQDRKTATVDVATAEPGDTEATKSSEETTPKEADEAVTRVGVSAVMDAVTSE
ncbi:hypothetical protein CPT_Sycamore_057 [Streptomyces phage Sycamore]|uniref:Uncharacterized protein n=1 Tax=Streptomyces phage Sycamore TaxID=2767589 RepID=A0A873WDQ7_9CAUD|nr:hypothetical protein CPT_Sycamore_057 [Streptomyces phage Sycamore]